MYYRDGAGAVEPVLMGLCCAPEWCWRGSSSPEIEGKVERSSGVRSITCFQVRFGYRTVGIWETWGRSQDCPVIYEWTWRFGALLNHSKNTDLYFLLPKALKPSTWTPQLVQMVQMDWSSINSRPSRGNPLNAKQIPICHPCNLIPTISSSWCWLLSEPGSRLLGSWNTIAVPLLCVLRARSTLTIQECSLLQCCNSYASAWRNGRESRSVMKPGRCTGHRKMYIDCMSLTHFCFV